MSQGGGSTFAVLISVTMRAFPRIGYTLYVFSYNTTSNSDTFWSLGAYFHNQLPDLSDKGVMGYYYLAPEDVAETDPAQKGKVYGVWLVPQKSPEEAKQILAPMEASIRNNTFKWKDRVVMANITAYSPDFSSSWALNQPGTVGSEVRLASRLLGRKALETNQAKLAKVLKATTTFPQYQILGHLVAGKGVKNVKIPGGSNSVLPAWRDAYTHIGKHLTPVPVPPSNTSNTSQSSPAPGPTSTPPPNWPPQRTCARSKWPLSALSRPSQAHTSTRRTRPSQTGRRHTGAPITRDCWS